MGFGSTRMTDATRKTIQSAIDADASVAEAKINSKNAAGNMAWESLIPTPPQPPVIKIGAGQSITTLDNVDLNAKPNTVYVLYGTVVCKKKQTIGVTGVTIRGVDSTAMLDADGAGWKENLYSFTGGASKCGFASLRVCGHDGGELCAPNGPADFFLIDVHQESHPVHKGGAGLVNGRNLDRFVADSCTSQKQARYAIYLADVRTATLKKLNFGPCACVDPTKMSEHPIRIYGAVGLLMSDCQLSNTPNKDGKQALKLMSGDGATIINCTFTGSTRFGRDVNDPSTNMLKNVVVKSCHFTDWVKIDPGVSDMLIDSSNVTASHSGFVFSVASGSGLKIRDTKTAYTDPSGKFSSGNVDTSLGGNTFQGKPI